MIDKTFNLLSVIYAKPQQFCAKLILRESDATKGEQSFTLLYFNYVAMQSSINPHCEDESVENLNAHASD